MKTLEEVQAELDIALADNTAMRGKLAALATKYPEEVNLSDSADPRVSMLLKQVRDGKKSALIEAAAGKVPKAKQDLVLALADSFSTGEVIELSDGTAKVKSSQFDVLADLLRAIPSMVAPGKLNLADGEDEKPLDLGKLRGKI